MVTVPFQSLCSDGSAADCIIGNNPLTFILITKRYGLRDDSVFECFLL